MNNHVVLVDEKDREIGVEDKIKVHIQPRLHRAFSVFLFNGSGKLLLQQRAADKYHSGGLWTNTCCSHPRPGERTERAAARRLVEEMGISCPLRKAFDFVYRASVYRGLTEYELDHVFIGCYNGAVHPNPLEVMDHRWVAIGDLNASIQADPHRYTPWLVLALERVVECSRGGLRSG